MKGKSVGANPTNEVNVSHLDRRTLAGQIETGVHVVGLIAYDPRRDTYHLLRGESLTRGSSAPKPGRKRCGQLSPRELQILQLVAGGLSNEAIGKKLGIALNTVKRHLQSIFARLDATTRSEAVIKALHNGWLNFA
ncbi:MAG: LuxR C-terminal-related transcriptional regulator [Chloroflexi bacterium]|nr:LuxR C-terminal-related transcriptional regulator [Chloroflexota bacterium]MDA8189725.1 LuxR C-terminal-related transcriptional regulator [Dehalococcoidales bacterium]